MVEQPELYTIGRCRANDEQILYTETRLECLEDIPTKIKLKNGAEISDKMR